jgi:hypothetical protein
VDDEELWQSAAQIHGQEGNPISVRRPNRMRDTYVRGQDQRLVGVDFGYRQGSVAIDCGEAGSIHGKVAVDHVGSQTAFLRSIGVGKE